jgi:hypothetical protein
LEFQEKRNAVIQRAMEQWQHKYGISDKGSRFRELVSDATCTIKLSKLPLAALLQETSRLILSKLVQFQSRHELVGAWFQCMGI